MRLKKKYSHHKYYVFDVYEMTRGIYDYQKEYFYRHLGSLDEKVKHIEISANHMPTPVYDEVWKGICKH